MAYLYLLESVNKKHTYLGSALDVDVRLTQHNQGTTTSTRSKGPWTVVKTWECTSDKEVRQIEYSIKKMKRKLTIEYISYFLDQTKKNINKTA